MVSESLSDPVEMVSVSGGQRRDLCCRKVMPNGRGVVRPDDL